MGGTQLAYRGPTITNSFPASTLDVCRDLVGTTVH
jgi:hypothetical protein